jgi:thiol:disulfide interchange protein DsbD
MFKKKLFQRLALTVLLAAAGQQTSLAQQSSAPGLPKRLADLLQPKQDQLLEPEQAFRLKTAFRNPTTLVADLIPADGYYLYRSRIRFAVKNSNGVAIQAVRLPTGKVKNDPTFGTTEVYEQPVQAEIALQRAPTAGSFTLVASWQGCHEKTGVCYPPVNTELTLVLPPAAK